MPNPPLKLPTEITLIIFDLIERSVDILDQERRHIYASLSDTCREFRSVLAERRRRLLKLVINPYQFLPYGHALMKAIYLNDEHAITFAGEVRYFMWTQQLGHIQPSSFTFFPYFTNITHLELTRLHWTNTITPCIAALTKVTSLAILDCALSDNLDRRTFVECIRSLPLIESRIESGELMAGSQRTLQLWMEGICSLTLTHLTLEVSNSEFLEQFIPFAQDANGRLRSFTWNARYDNSLALMADLLRTRWCARLKELRIRVWSDWVGDFPVFGKEHLAHLTTLECPIKWARILVPGRPVRELFAFYKRMQRDIIFPPEFFATNPGSSLTTLHISFHSLRRLSLRALEGLLSLDTLHAYLEGTMHHSYRGLVWLVCPDLLQSFSQKEILLKLFAQVPLLHVLPSFRRFYVNAINDLLTWKGSLSVDLPSQKELLTDYFSQTHLLTVSFYPGMEWTRSTQTSSDWDFYVPANSRSSIFGLLENIKKMDEDSRARVVDLDGRLERVVAEENGWSAERVQKWWPRFGLLPTHKILASAVGLA